MFNPFNKKMEIKKFPKEKEDCKIKIKRTADGGKSISFSGDCSREQLEMAKINFSDNEDKEEY